jgi:soluble lytic murein transglycosylase-like protein
MSRLLCLLTLTLGLAQGVAAQEQSQQTPQAQATPQAAPLETSFSPASLPASQDAAASDATTQTTHKVSRMLSEKFGVARAKAEQISAAVMSAASKYSLPPALLLAIISIESRFKEKARGANGATGLMQVVPAAHRQLVRNIDLTQAEANIEAGSAILHGYVESAQGDVGAALKSYGGSKAYAEKVSLQVKKFAPQTGLQTASEATPD